MEMVKERPKKKKEKKVLNTTKVLQTKEDFVPAKQSKHLEETQEKKPEQIITNGAISEVVQCIESSPEKNKLDKENEAKQQESTHDYDFPTVQSSAPSLIQCSDHEPISKQSTLDYDSRVQSQVPVVLESSDHKPVAEVKRNESTGVRTFSDLNTELASVKQTEVGCKESVVSQPPKCHYPDLAKIQSCERLEKIMTLKTLVRTYADEYTNRTISEANKRHQEFVQALVNLENYQLFEMIDEFSKARRSSAESGSEAKLLRSKLKSASGNLWEPVRKEVTANGRCGDGNQVSATYSYDEKALVDEKFKETTQVLGKLENLCSKQAFYSYSDELTRLRIEQHFSNLLSDYKGLGEESNCLDVLRKCISALFHFLRQPSKDRQFFLTCQKWLKALVPVLYKNGSKHDHIFILNHVLRCPRGINSWASRFIQLLIQDDCGRSSNGTFSCECQYYILLIIYCVLNPVRDRDFFLRNLSVDFCEEVFVSLDSLGEEEDLFEVIREWNNDDVISLLKQISVGLIYKHVLRRESDEIQSDSERKLVKVFAFSRALINIFFTGMNTYCKENFGATIELICQMISKTMSCISDYWLEHLRSPEPNSLLQAEFDRLFFHVVFNLFHFKRFEVWKFLSFLPFASVSKKMLWNVLWIFHAPLIQEDEIYCTKDVSIRLQDKNAKSLLVGRLESLDEKSQSHFLCTYKTIAMESEGEEEFFEFIFNEIFQVFCVEEKLMGVKKSGQEIMRCLLQKYPKLLTALLKQIDIHDERVALLSAEVTENLMFPTWIPGRNDMIYIRGLLLSNPLTSPKNSFARKILTQMNWGYSQRRELCLPISLHQEIAVLVLEAYRKYDSTGHSWSVSYGLAQILQFASMGNYKREDEGFVSWAWNLLFSLKVHALDQRSPPWVQIFDGNLFSEHIPDAFQDSWLQPMLFAYEARHPSACYLMLAMTNVGHSSEKLMREGILCLTSLVENQHYLAAIQSLYYTLPFFAKNWEELLAKPEFLHVMSSLIGADLGMWTSLTQGGVVGACLKEIAAMIKNQISLAASVSVEFAVPLLKLWTRILVKITSQDMKSHNLSPPHPKQVNFLLDVVLKMSLSDAHTRNCMVEVLNDLGNPLSSMGSQEKSWFKWLLGRTDAHPLLRQPSFPDQPCLAWAVLTAGRVRR